MGKGVGVPFVADVAPFLKGTGQVEDALSDVIDSLDEVAQQGRTTEQVISRSLDNTAEDARTASGKLEGQFKTAFDSIVADSKTAAAKAEGHIDDIPTHARTTSKSKFAGLGTELGGEFAQNIGEGVSSNAIGASGAADLALGTVGGVLPALGPIGAAIGVGALIVSNIVQGITNNQTQVTEAVKAAVKTAYDAASELLDGPKPVSIGDIIKGFTPDQIAAFEASHIAIYDAADAIATYQNTGDRTKLDAITRPINDRKAALDGLTTASGSLFDSKAPNMFDIGGPLAADAPTLAALKASTDAIDATAAAYTKLQTAANLVDINKLKSIGMELGRPVNQSNSSLLRYLTS